MRMDCRGIVNRQDLVPLPSHDPPKRSMLCFKAAGTTVAPGRAGPPVVTVEDTRAWMAATRTRSRVLSLDINHFQI